MDEKKYMEMLPTMTARGLTIKQESPVNVAKHARITANEEVHPTNNITSPEADEENDLIKKEAVCESKIRKTREQEIEEEKGVALPKIKKSSQRTTLEAGRKLRKMASSMQWRQPISLSMEPSEQNMR